MSKHARSRPRLPDAISGLSPYVWRGFDKRHRLGKTHATGFEALDAQLPGGGWPAAALTEIILEHHGIGELSLLMPAIARLCASDVDEQVGDWVFWIAPPFIPYAPALGRHGIDLRRMLLVHASATSRPLRKSLVDAMQGENRFESGAYTTVREHFEPIFNAAARRQGLSQRPARSAGLWVAEQALRAGSCAAVLVWARSADQTALRRLQLAAEQARCWTVLFRPVSALRERSPAALRLRLTRVGSMTQVEILKCRGARPAIVHIRCGDTEC